jgi:hypothetical protein
MERVARPPDNAPVPSVVLLSMNVTAPVGEPTALQLMVAVNVTDWLKADGFKEDCSEVEVAVLETVWVKTADVLPEKLLSPPYTALMEWEPTASAEVVSVACALPFREPVPNVVVPSMNVTVPVGAPEPEVGATVAVKVTGWPGAAGFVDEASVVDVGCVTVNCAVPLMLFRVAVMVMGPPAATADAKP